MLKYRNIALYMQLMRVDKPIGFLLLWWPVMWALWLASDGAPRLSNVFIFTLGCYLMRSAGCVINDFADRDIDQHVERTKLRPLTSGAVSAKETLVLFLLLCFLAFLLVLHTNVSTVILSVPAVCLAALYPFTKRWFMFPQFFLGAAFAWGIVMVVAAQNQALEAWVWVLYVSVLAWTVAYDTMYAMLDREDDKKIGVKSTAIWFGRFDKKIILCLQCIFLVLLMIVGFMKSLPFVFYVSVIISTVLCIYQQIKIRSNVRALFFEAFLNNQWIGLIVFMGLFFSYL